MSREEPFQPFQQDFLQAVTAAPVTLSPCPFLHGRLSTPAAAALFPAMRRLFPLSDKGSSEYETGAEVFRSIVPMEEIADPESRKFWEAALSASFNAAFTQVLLRKFLAFIPRYQRFTLLQKALHFASAGSKFAFLEEKQKAELLAAPAGFDWMFTCDETGYALEPHTDHPRKMITFLLYLSEPSEGAPIPGTSVYAPLSSRTRAWDSTRAKREKFTEVFRAPHLEGHFLAFVKSDVSWHGVEPCLERRSRMTLNLTLHRPPSLGG